jgi:ATP/ADP translocase
MRHRALVRIIPEVWVKVMSALKELAAKLGHSHGSLYDPSCRSRGLIGCIATFEVIRVNPSYKIVLLIYIYVYIYHLVINNIEGGGGGGKAI